MTIFLIIVWIAYFFVTLYKSCIYAKKEDIKFVEWYAAYLACISIYLPFIITPVWVVYKIIKFLKKKELGFETINDGID